MIFPVAIPHQQVLPQGSDCTKKLFQNFLKMGFKHYKINKPCEKTQKSEWHLNSYKAMFREEKLLSMQQFAIIHIKPLLKRSASAGALYPVNRVKSSRNALAKIGVGLAIEETKQRNSNCLKGKITRQGVCRIKSLAPISSPALIRSADFESPALITAEL